jgi:dehydrogenase/reductase SDR family protein 7
MNVDYVAARIVRSALADVDELVLAPQPIMALTYCVRFFPTLAYAALDVIGPKRARRADAGENMYDLLEKTRQILESIGDVDSKESKGKSE